MMDAYKCIQNKILEEKDSSKSSEHRKERRQKLKSGTQELIKHMAEEEVPYIPSYWSKHQGESIAQVILNYFRNRKYEKVELDPKCRFYRAIEKLFVSTFDVSLKGQGKDAKGLERLNYSKLVVRKIQRIENPDLFSGYFNIKQKQFRQLYKLKKSSWPKVEDLPNSSGVMKTECLLKDLSKDMHPEINEVFVFHGTNDSIVKKICNEGLDPRLAGDNAMFGRGVYGAEKSQKADQYTGVYFYNKQGFILNQIFNKVENPSY